MSLITREVAAQNGTNRTAKNDHSSTSHDRLDINQGEDNKSNKINNNQLAQRNASYSKVNDVPRDYNAPQSSLAISKQHTEMDRSPNGLADFFSTEVFQIVLHNPTTAHRLLKFSQARMCGENMEFLEKVCQPILSPTVHPPSPCTR